MKIRSIEALEILDSRGQPTIETKVVLADGSSGAAAVPAGASTGSHEAREKRDGGERYGGAGVRQAVANVEQLAGILLGREAEDQAALDHQLCQADGTADKSKLGANTILSISLAVAAAQAKAEKKPLCAYLAKFNPDFKGQYKLPRPMLNIINGGRHANWSTDIQEYLIIPIGATAFGQALRMSAEVYQQLKLLLAEQNYNITVGDEGGFAPAVDSNEQPLVLISQAIERAGYVLNKDFAFGLDIAASEFYQDGQYQFKKTGQNLSAAKS